MNDELLIAQYLHIIEFYLNAYHQSYVHQDHNDAKLEVVNSVVVISSISI